jgi:hypothetical protein
MARHKKVLAEPLPVPTDETYKKSIIAAQEYREQFLEQGKEILKTILEKISLLVNSIDKESIAKANLSSKGSTLKSLTQAYHLVLLHFEEQFSKYEEKSLTATSTETLPSSNEFENPENILEKTTEITIKARRKFL